jgi:hypothetical protein
MSKLGGMEGFGEFGHLHIRPMCLNLVVLFERSIRVGEEVAIHFAGSAIIILGDNYILLVQFLIWLSYQG